MKINRIFIDKYKIFSNFELKFYKGDNENRPNLIIVAGVNGSGKTSLLKYIKKKLENFAFDQDGEIDLEPEFSDDNFLLKPIESIRIDKFLKNQIDEYEKEGKKGFVANNKGNSILYKNASGKIFSVVKGKENLFIKAVKNLHENLIFFNTEKYPIENINKLIFNYVKKLIFEGNIPPLNAYKAVQEIIDNAFNEFNLNIKFSKIDTSFSEGIKSNFIVYFRNEVNDEIMLSDLSTGEKELVAKALYLYLIEPKNKLILIDEPERSLHPKWQQNIMNVYKDVSKKFNCQMIIATHSPQVIASLDPQSIYILERTDGKKSELKLSDEHEQKKQIINVFNMQELNKKTKGLEPNRILMDIMGLSTLRYIETEKKIGKLLKFLNVNDFLNPDATSLIKSLRNELGESDPFIIRLNFQLKILKNKLNQ